MDERVGEAEAMLDGGVVVERGGEAEVMLGEVAEGGVVGSGCGSGGHIYSTSTKIKLNIA